MSAYLQPIFDTDVDKVHALLNLDVGTNLASIGNKLYLVYCGDITEDTEDTIEEVTTTTTTEGSTVEKSVTVTYPNGGEFFEIGSTYTITWTSDKSVNDAVKIDLYNGDEVSFTINSKTSNDGAYEWTVPATIDIGSDYKIAVTWLSANEVSEADFDLSDDVFSIGFEAPITTTTTTTAIDTTRPHTDSCRGIPIMELPNDEYITDMIKDTRVGGVLFSTSKGRILTCREATLNAYLTGERNVYAEVKDGFGNISDTAWTSFMYALYNRVITVNEDKEAVNWRFEENASAIMTERITGEFLSPVLYVREDIGFWKTLTWTETKPDNTDVLIFLRTGDSTEDLQSKPWDICFRSEDAESGTITREIINSGLEGRYIQIRVVMTTDASETTPSVLDLGVAYSTKFAVYFFTTKFELENDSGLKSGLLTANMTQPQGTEVIFGICETNSADWNDYDAVEVDRLFEIDDWERIKVGIKMVSHGDNVPVVGEFALVTGSEINNLMNQ